MSGVEVKSTQESTQESTEGEIYFVLHYCWGGGALLYQQRLKNPIDYPIRLFYTRTP